MAQRPTGGPPAAHDHRVGFFENDAAFAASIAGFLDLDPRGAGRGVVVATPDRRAGIARALADRGHDVGELERSGHLVLLDAARTLRSISVGGSPDPARFEQVVGELLDTVAADGRPARLYGEMVALLWEQGDIAGAIALERYWNALGSRREFSLLCGYPLSSFADADHAEAFEAICDLHTEVVPTDEDASGHARTPPDPGVDPEQGRTVAALQQHLAAVQAERDRLAEELARADQLHRAHERFFERLVHDLRVPASSSSEALRHLRRRGSHLGADAEQQELLGSAADDVARIDRLVADLHTAARVAAADFEYEVGEVDLARIVSQAVAQARSTTGREIHVRCEADPAGAHADEVRQHQILSNLLANAVAHSPERSAIRVRLTRSVHELTVTVTDEGEGLGSGDHDAVFEPFAQLDPGVVRGGTGLGLSLARMLVEGQGGQLWVQSRRGQGASFRYTVPASELTTRA